MNDEGKFSFLFGGVMGFIAGVATGWFFSSVEWAKTIDKGWYMCGEQICVIKVDRRDVLPADERN